MHTKLRSVATAVLLCFAFLLGQTAHAQTNTATGVEALLSNTTGTFNTAAGYRALRNNTTGSRNSAHGAEALAANTTGNNNTASGYQALFSNTIGSNNTANGFNALFFNTAGSNNTASGHQALTFNSIGANNTASGYQALFFNNIGSRNTATGFRALFANSGDNNTANGVEALTNNTTGVYNTAMGAGALGANIFGNVNTAVGSNALGKNTTGNASTAVGESALYNNTTGRENTATGFYALYSNTTGYHNTASGMQALYTNTTGILNTAAGYSALRFNTTGQENTAHGIYASYHSTTGYFNTSSGAYALFANGSGARNTASGAVALASVTTGIDNTALGTGAGFSFNHSQSTFIGSTSNATVAVNNATALGYGAIVTGDNQVRIGNSAVSSIGGQVNWTAFSDGRFKKNAKEDVPGLSFITKLRPVTYSLDIEGIDQKLRVEKPQLSLDGISEASKLRERQRPSAEEKKARAEKAKVVYTGFVAQEVEEAAKALNYDFSGVDKPKNKEDFYGLRYGDFVVPPVKAVQELSAENKELREKNEKLEERIARLESLIVGGTITPKSNNTVVNLSGAYLKQNAPNPHRGNTVIQYHLPQGTSSAQVVITNSKGQVLKTVSINSQGEGQLTLNAGTLPAGTYTYSLWIEGRQADSKQMVIVK